MENVTHLAGDSEPFEWEVLDKDGNRTMRVSRGSAGNYTITFLDNKGGQFAKEWQADSTLSIHSEQVRGEDGSYSFTHGSL